MTIAGSLELYLGANQARAGMVASSSLHHFIPNNNPAHDLLQPGFTFQPYAMCFLPSVSIVALQKDRRFTLLSRAVLVC